MTDEEREKYELFSNKMSFRQTSLNTLNTFLDHSIPLFEYVLAYCNIQTNRNITEIYCITKASIILNVSQPDLQHHSASRSLKWRIITAELTRDKGRPGDQGR